MPSWTTQDTLDQNGKVISTRVIAADGNGRQFFSDVPVAVIAGVDPSVVLAAVATQVASAAAGTMTSQGPAVAVHTDDAVEAIAVALGGGINPTGDNV